MSSAVSTAFFCQICSVNMGVGDSSLKRHIEGKAHKKQLKKVANAPPVIQGTATSNQEAKARTQSFVSLESFVLLHFHFLVQETAHALKKQLSDAMIVDLIQNHVLVFRNQCLSVRRNFLLQYSPQELSLEPWGMPLLQEQLIQSLRSSTRVSFEHIFQFAADLLECLSYAAVLLVRPHGTATLDLYYVCWEMRHQMTAAHSLPPTHRRNGSAPLASTHEENHEAITLLSSAPPGILDHARVVVPNCFRSFDRLFGKQLVHKNRIQPVVAKGVFALAPVSIAIRSVLPDQHLSEKKNAPGTGPANRTLSVASSLNPSRPSVMQADPSLHQRNSFHLDSFDSDEEFDQTDDGFNEFGDPRPYMDYF